ncbi:hypothetical protein IV58_GL001290 [Lactobacillus delbrueckii subsp. jakobsenii ZN7a-9 = DSM 26046]|nr:hypothetical protein IV58_GL001290 [Lactobacillus delbrueckii subsp. jakobsenii ZN7a-9 = DSM 26046]
MLKKGDKMMKEKNWLTVLALVVGFAAMGASVWLSAQAVKQTQRNSLPSYFPVGGAKPRYFYRKKSGDWQDGRKFDRRLRGF